MFTFCMSSWCISIICIKLNNIAETIFICICLLIHRGVKYKFIQVFKKRIFLFCVYLLSDIVRLPCWFSLLMLLLNQTLTFLYLIQGLPIMFLAHSKVNLITIVVLLSCGYCQAIQLFLSKLQYTYITFIYAKTKLNTMLHLTQRNNTYPCFFS